MNCGVFLRQDGTSAVLDEALANWGDSVNGEPIETMMLAAACPSDALPPDARG